MLILFVDQLSKNIAIHILRGQPMASYLGDIFRLEYSENAGAFLSLGAQLSESTRFWILNVGVSGALIACLVFLLCAKDMSRFELTAFSLMFSGGLGNLLDRIFRDNGRVVDFMNMGIGNLRTGIFNVADMAIMAGILLFLLSQAKRDRLKSTE